MSSSLARHSVPPCTALHRHLTRTEHTISIGRWPHVQLAHLAWAVTTCELYLGFSGMLPTWALALETGAARALTLT